MNNKIGRIISRSGAIDSTNQLRSKLVDGLLAGSVLVLFELLLILLIQPIQMVFSRPGLLVYTLVLISSCVICLERSLHHTLPEFVQAWWGVLGGMTAWVVIELNSSLGNQDIASETGMLNLILVLLIASVLWRKVAPLGLRYYLVMLLLGWAGHNGLVSLAFLTTSLEPRLAFVLPLIGYLAAIFLVLSVAYIFLRSRDQLDRLNAAMAIWLTAMVMITIFRGGLGLG